LNIEDSPYTNQTGTWYGIHVFHGIHPPAG
jgi:hypothetical protein